MELELSYCDTEHARPCVFCETLTRSSLVFRAAIDTTTRLFGVACCPSCYLRTDLNHQHLGV
jgi:hypothetical protein